MRLLRSAHCALAILALLGWGGLAHAERFAASVVKVHAVGADGVGRFGSGVMVAPERIATACHVTRHAEAITITHGTRRWLAESQVGSLVHDLCVLIVPAADVPIARVRRSDELNPGERIIAAGFEGGGEELVEARGTVAALYPYDGGKVIRTSAPFDLGSSGGGLFDEGGNLVGVLAFKARTGENLRFALPTEWISPVAGVSRAFGRIQPTSSPVAFWERARKDRPAFLGAALSEAAAIATGRP